MSCYFDIFDLGGTKAVWGYFGAYSSVVEQYIDNVFVRGSNPLRLKRYAFGSEAFLSKFKLGAVPPIPRRGILIKKASPLEPPP